MHRILAVRRDTKHGTEWATSPVELVTSEDGTAAASCEWGTFRDLGRALRKGEIYDQTGVEDVVDLVASMPDADLCELAPPADEEKPRPDAVPPAEVSPVERVLARRAEREAKRAEEAKEAAAKVEREEEIRRLLAAMGADPETLDEEERTRAELLRLNGIPEEGKPERRKSEALARAMAKIEAHRERAAERARQAEEARAAREAVAGALGELVTIGAEDLGTLR